LNPAAASKESDPKKCADVILQATGLDPDMYRLGHTKVYCLLLLSLFIYVEWRSTGEHTFISACTSSAPLKPGLLP